MKINYNSNEIFLQRHIDTDATHIQAICETIGVKDVEELIDQTVPENIRLKKPLQLPNPKTEQEFLAEFKKITSKNKIFKSYLGKGYYGTHTPNVILRNILENPSWYTAYTPYQAEIAQGRMEALINFQTMVIDLTGMEIANASLLDEATSAAEAMSMLFASRSPDKRQANKYFVANHVYQHTLDVLKTRAQPLGIEIVSQDWRKMDLNDSAYFGLMVQYPAQDGEIEDFVDFFALAKENKIFTAVASDLLALTLLTPPGEFGADVVVGSTQRFGVPMGFGGPHAAFFAAKDSFKRNMPGRIIGVSVDAQGNPAYRMALQTREQHIRREKATSNICTAQVLLSVMASMYAVYHGPNGLKEIAKRVHALTKLLAFGIEKIGLKQKNRFFFDTLNIEVKVNMRMLRAEAEKAEMNFYIIDPLDQVHISFDETTTLSEVDTILGIFAKVTGKPKPELDKLMQELDSNVNFPAVFTRRSSYLNHSVFNSYHTEHEMLRYIKKLESKDFSLAHGMIPLGSCTMKLNATTEMIPVTWQELSLLHPFVPKEQSLGYQEIFKNLEKWLCEITGFAGVSLQPNSGAQGEYAGLLTIRAYHASRNQAHRNITLIPSSAHGTNPASAVLAGMKVVVVKCDALGNIDVEDLKSKVIGHESELACLMVTYPSTHGVFEEAISEICDVVHQYGGLVYMDGANMNAQVGLTSPAKIGADVCHLNLHKTFCIPHGGGGPGMGPICVVEKLIPFLPGHIEIDAGLQRKANAVSAAPYGSASILSISYAYISMMGAKGLTEATKVAILNANYIKNRLENHYPILYSGKNGRCAHELIVDCRPFKITAGVEVEDIAKRLIDYGFHAPTVSFPVAGTLMIEPTESETKQELDRFCEAMISIRREIAEIEQGAYSKDINVLKMAPHTAEVVTKDSWDLPYTRQKAAYPTASVKANKFWPSVSRIDGAFGDRNLVCSCLPVEQYEQ